MPFFAIGDMDISDDGRWLAYTTDTTGFRQYTLHIKDLETGDTLTGQWSAWAACLGGGQPDDLLYRGGRAAEAAVPAVAGSRATP